MMYDVFFFCVHLLYAFFFTITRYQYQLISPFLYILTHTLYISESILQYCRLLHAHSFYTLRVLLPQSRLVLSTARQLIIISVLLK